MAEPDNFGTLLRRTRKALGLTLRAFCHQNGFDAANVSRIERGLTPPPKKDDGLEKFAKALKLKKGSDAHNRFLDLAATETGRIPGELLQARNGKLPKLFRQLRRGAGHRNWVRALHLNQWAETLAARSVLPQLIRRLTHATGRSITFVSVPALKQTQRTGLDGVVDAAESDAFVPLGRSVWEMGVSKDPGKKAEEDFKKRQNEKLGFDKKEAVYIFVTPQNWPGKQKWIDAKTKLKVWREVRVYDSANLEEWLELAPAVDVWLARQLEIRPEGLSDIEEYWENLSSVTEPPLKPAVFLSSRKKQADGFTKWLEGPAGVITLEVRSPGEAVDFVAAVMRQMKEQEAVTARTVLVHEKEAWRSICRTDARLILIAHPDLNLDEETVAEAVRQGHHVVLPISQSVAARVLTLKLPLVYRHHLEEALRESGLEGKDASDYARKAGGSLTVLKRLLGKVSGTRVPAWCSAVEGKSLVPILLAGAWEDQVEGDRAALARLAGREYEAVKEVAQRWLNTPDPPVKRILSRLSLVSRDDSWFLLSHAIESVHLETFEQIAVEVLGDNDPALDISPDERWMASIHGKVLRYSHTLRTGIVESLALLGARPERISITADPQGVATRVVRKLLETKDWKRWASLSQDLPVLAEAAPDTFLKAVESDLNSKNPVIPKLFEQDGRSALFSSSPHCGLLWALEGLAWNRGELARVSYVLARLDEILVGMKSGNSPMATLTEIYLPWFPQTTSPVEERVKILREICSRYSGTGWRLLLELIPDQVRHSSPIRRPEFRDWALAWNDSGPTISEYDRQVAESSELTVEFAGEDITRLMELIEHFENLTAQAGDKLLNRLSSFNASSDDRRRLSETLRKKVTHHRRFKDADWALPEADLVPLEEVQRRLQPSDAVSKNAWLFNQIWEVIAHEGQTGENEVTENRRHAIREILAEEGWDGILKFAAVVKAPDELGFALGGIGSPKEDTKILPELLHSEEEHLKKLAYGYVGGRFYAESWAWAEKLKVAKWPPAYVAEIAQLLPVTPRTWAFVAKRGKEAEREYWQKTWRPLTEPEPNVVREAVAKLIQYKRPFQAVFVIGMARHRECEVASQLVAEVLEAGFDHEISDSERELIGLRRHYIAELVQSLQKVLKSNVSDIEISRVARIEWFYLGLLDGHPAKPETLYSMLGTDPNLFVDLLVAIYPERDDDSDEKAETSEEDKTRAINARRLLMSWKRIPGSGEDRVVNGEALLAWTSRARTLAKEKNRLEVCDSRIGEVLAYAPMDADDGGWPCIAVRDLIEEVGSDDLERGLAVGVYNKRGVYRKAYDEGGAQERRLSESYRTWAELCKIEWTRTARSLRSIADSYDQEAGRADADTEFRLS